MSLDQNLFTLVFTPNKDHPNVTDLVDPSGTVHYHKRRVAGAEYKIEVFDPLSESLLITATAPSASTKVKILELYNPTSIVELKHTGTLSFKWSFKWEEHEFEWKREQCFLIRKPDPPVLVAVTKEPTRQVRTAQVQLLDYNLHRFDIDDRKGLEIVMLTALMTFHDAKDNTDPASVSLPMSPQSEQPPAGTLSRVVSGSMVPLVPPGSLNALSSGSGENGSGGGLPPLPPPKPAKKTGLDRIKEMQALKGEEYNEITVEEEGSVVDYAQYCNSLLTDDAMLFISVKSTAAEFVPKVLQIVEETKRIRYKAGLDEETELHQYVLYDTEKKKGPRRINLNDDAEEKAKYAPPSSLIVHLSKIDMPELMPKTTLSSSSSSAKKRESVVDKRKSKVPTPSSSKPSTPPPPPSSSSSSKNKASAATLNVPNSSSSSSAGKSVNAKPSKSKLTRPPRDKSPMGKYPEPAVPPVGSSSSKTPTLSRPVSGLFNSRRTPPPQSSSGALGVSFSKSSSGPAPSFPVPYDGKYSSGGGPETPGLSFYNLVTPQTQGSVPPPPPHGQQASSSSGKAQSGGGGSGLNADVSNLMQKPSLSNATTVAQGVVTGLFDMVKSHRSKQ